MAVAEQNGMEQLSPGPALGMRRGWYRRAAARLGELPVVPGLILVVVIVVGIFGPYITPHDPVESSLMDAFTPPFEDSTYILGTDHYQVELLSSLDRVPESGALVVVSFPKPRNGSGFPARVFAILP